MKHKVLLVPDAMHRDIYHITPAKLLAHHKKGIIFDIDNTVAPYEVATPTQKMKTYFASLVSAGIEIAFVSNNKSDRAEIFNASLGFFCVSDAGKPRPDGIVRCIAHMGLPEREMLLVGDQIFTDCLAAHRAGLDFWLVNPIKDKETLFFRAKRLFERPYIAEGKRRKEERKALKKQERSQKRADRRKARQKLSSSIRRKLEKKKRNG